MSAIRRPSYHAGSVIYVSSGTYYMHKRSDGTLTSSTDAATVIQQALNLGGRVFITAGTYPITASLTFSIAGTQLEGEGSATILQFDGSLVSPLLKMGDTTQRSIHIRNLKITSTTATAGTAIDAGYFVISNFQNLDITANIGIDFNVLGTYYNYVENSKIVVAGSGGIGIRFNNTSNENTVIRTRIGAGDANPTGVYINAHGNSLYDVDVEGGSNDCLYGIDIGATGHDTLISGVYLEGNQTNVRLASGVEGVTFVGGFIADGTTANITDNGSSKTVYLNTRIGNGSYEPQTSIGLLQFTRSETAPANSEYYVSQDNSTSPTRMRFNVPTGSQFDFKINNAAIINASASTFNLNSLTMQNATLRAANVLFGDGTDQTKKFGFDASGISTATTRTYTAPNGSGTIMISNRSGASDPTTTDIKAGEAAVWKNTTSGAVKLWYNDSGTMKSVALS